MKIFQVSLGGALNWVFIRNDGRMTSIPIFKSRSLCKQTIKIYLAPRRATVGTVFVQQQSVEWDDGTKRKRRELMDTLRRIRGSKMRRVPTIFKEDT